MMRAVTERREGEVMLTDIMNPGKTRAVRCIVAL